MRLAHLKLPFPLPKRKPAAPLLRDERLVVVFST